MKPASFPRSLPAALLLLALAASACSDSTAPASYIRVRITSPPEDTLLAVPPVRIAASVEASCGCQRYVEFRIDDSLRYTDYAAPYEYQWNFAGVPGRHKIHTTAILTGKAVGVDSLYVQTE